MKEKLEKNFKALNERVFPLFLEIGRHTFKVAGKKPVKLKACIEQLIAEGKMDKGRIWQHPKYVEYCPDGSNKRFNVI